MARYRIPRGRMDALTPIGQAVSNLGNLFLQMPTREERMFNAARAENTGLEAQLNRNRLQGQTALGDIFRRSFGALPAGVAPDDHVRSQFGDLATAAANVGAVGQIGDLFRAAMINRPGSTEDAQTRAFVGAGGSMSGSPGGFASDQRRQEREAGNRNATTLAASRYASDRASATQEAIANRTLVHVRGADGSPVYARAVDAAGQPVAAPARAPSNQFVVATGPNGERESMRADDPRADERARSGWTVAGANVQATSPDALTPNQRGNEELRARSLLRLQRLMGDAYRFSENPANFGATGSFRGLVQDLGQQATAAMGYLSPEWRERIESGRRSLTETAGVPNFDPTLPQLNMVTGMLPYIAAEAVANQSGRGVSNEDVRRWERIVGSLGPITNQAEFRARMELLDDIIVREVNAVRGSNPAVGPMLPRGGQPPPATGGGAPGAAPRRIRLRPDAPAPQ